MTNDLPEKNALALISQNEELAALYRDNAHVGASNLAGTLPQLKIHTQGKSSSNILEDGSEPNDGWFFYKPTSEQFETVECHVLTISRGYRSEGFQGKQNVFNQLLGGVIMDGTDFKPFILYFTGLKLQNLWDFGKEAGKYTKAKPIPIPMFALTVMFTTEKVSHNFGKSWVVKFEIEKDEKGIPKVVTDPGLFQFLRDHVETVEETINSLIAAKSTGEEEEPNVPVTPITPTVSGEPEEQEDVPPREEEGEKEEDPDDEIPF